MKAVSVSEVLFKMSVATYPTSRRIFCESRFPYCCPGLLSHCTWIAWPPASSGTVHFLKTASRGFSFIKQKSSYVERCMLKFSTLTSMANLQVCQDDQTDIEKYLFFMTFYWLLLRIVMLEMTVNYLRHYSTSISIGGIGPYKSCKTV